MKTTPRSCNDDRLRLLIDGDDTSAEFAAAADHVDRCGRCRTRLLELTADEVDWRSAREFLSSGDDDATLFAERQSRSWLPDPDRDTTRQWNETIAGQLLDAPRHPEMLGRIGRFEVERLVGSGGMGIVFKGFDQELNRPVAIKLLAPHLAGSGAARKRFAREARAAAAVVHEHVVAIHSVESDADPPFLVMQYVNGESLQSRINREGPLDVREILRIGMQTARGLAAAHAQGLVHRDVKPSNILLEEDVERTLLTDFGLARTVDDASLTRSGHLPGTPHFMSPEQAQGEAIDQRSDLFSLGSVIYMMCTGRSPFRAESSYGILRRITDTEPRPIREINPDIPDWLCGIVNRLHAKSPDNRFASADTVADVLQHCLAHVQQPDTHPLPADVQFVATTDRRRWTFPAAIIGAIATLAVAGVVAWNAQDWFGTDIGTEGAQSRILPPVDDIGSTTREPRDDASLAGDIDTDWHVDDEFSATELRVEEFRNDSLRAFARGRE